MAVSTDISCERQAEVRVVLLEPCEPHQPTEHPVSCVCLSCMRQTVASLAEQVKSQTRSTWMEEEGRQHTQMLGISADSPGA